MLHALCSMLSAPNAKHSAPSATHSAPSAKLSAPSAMRYTLCAFILILSLLAFYQLSLRLISQVQYQQAKKLFRDGYYGLAVSHLKRANHYQPNDYKIQKDLGNTYYKVAELKTDATETFVLTQKAKDFYLKSSRLNPLDAETAYGLARGEARLEQIYRYLYPEKKDNPYHPMPYFEQAISLRPNDVLIHYALARYLYHYNRTDELLRTVQTLARIYPPIHWNLNEEPFWSPSAKEAFKAGLQQTLEEDISNKDAHKVMSYFLAREKDWSGAISHSKQALKYIANQNSAGDYYIHLGRLYLKNGQIEEAESSFFEGLDRSRTKEKDLEKLYHLYKNEGYPEELYQFYQQVSHRFILSSQMNILLARSLIDLKRYNQAQRILTDLNQKDPTAEAYYWLARIAEIEKDWDSMELAIQKATVLDPSNSHYHLLFSRVLKRMRKLHRAEKEAGLAIKYRAKPSAWLFDHRAWIRWSTELYLRALQDWRAAIALEPDRAYFYARAAEACTRLGNWPPAIDYYKKAMELDPENKKYKKRYHELKDILKAYS